MRFFNISVGVAQGEMMDDAVFTVDRDINHQRITYTLVVDAVALAEVELDDFDRRLLRECEGEGKSIADRLLALEMLMRRMEQQRATLKCMEMK